MGGVAGQQYAAAAIAVSGSGEATSPNDFQASLDVHQIGGSNADHVSALTRDAELELTDDQKSSVQKFQQDMMTEMQGMRGQFQGMSPEERQTKMAEIGKDHRKKIADILLQPQMDRLDELVIAADRQRLRVGKRRLEAAGEFIHAHKYLTCNLNWASPVPA